MRFTCGNCGRAYVADDRIEGLAFKMPCRRCGQIISVEGAPSPATEPATEAEPRAGRRSGPRREPLAGPRRGRTPPTAGKGRRALLVVVGVVILAATGGVAWYLEAPASRGVPPQAVRPREAASAATQAATSRRSPRCRSTGPGRGGARRARGGRGGSPAPLASR